MLLTMHIKNIALIEEIDIDFHEQLNILTGETGAGKSIIIGSLGICLGGKFPKELLRDDTKDGLVELVFSVDQPAIVEALEKLERFAIYVRVRCWLFIFAPSRIRPPAETHPAKNSCAPFFQRC